MEPACAFGFFAFCKRFDAKGKKKAHVHLNMGFLLVPAAGFELAT
jgi:hypothetical protein